MFVDEIYDGEATNSFNLAFRYEYNILITGSENNKIRTYLGFAASPYFKSINIEPLITTIWPKHFSSFGLDLGLVPRINYQVHDRVFLDISVPVNFARAGYQNMREKNPALPFDLQTTKIEDIRFLQGDSLIRLGAGIVL